MRTTVLPHPALFVAALLCASAPAAASDKPPQIDLITSRHLFHLYGEGLVVSFVSEGFRKYSQEYSSPWGQVSNLDGRAGRVLSGRAAILSVPADSTGPATLRVRAHGLTAGQKISVFVNGKNVKNTELPATWEPLLVPIADKILSPGDNELRFVLAKKAPQGYALFSSLELLPSGVEDAGAPPAPGPVGTLDVGAGAKEALTGFARHSVFVEIPPRARFEAQTGAAAATIFVLSATTPDGKTHALLDAKQDKGWAPRVVKLDALAGQLVRLDLAIKGDPKAAGWADARIVVEAPRAARPPVYKNAILIVVDALRQDRVPLYDRAPAGKTRVAMANVMKLFAEQGVAFMHNQAASPSSPPSHGSIQTGMIPRVHGVVGDKAQVEPGTPTISGQLADAGFATGYYGNNPFGMARQEKPGTWTEFHHPNQEGKSIDCTALVTEMLGFAEKQAKAGKRFFISSLPYETHTPYRYHEGVTDRFHKGDFGPPVGKLVDGDLLGKLSFGKLTLSESQWNQLRALYDGEAEHFDSCFAQLLQGLHKLGLAKDTAIVLTADHGEGLHEHGYMGHAWGHFEEVSAVPMVIFGAGLEPAALKVDVVTGHIDIVPTVLDLVGVRPSERIQGMSLLPLVQTKGAWTPRVLSLEYGRSYALRARSWKYIVDYDGSEHVYDLEKDPGEKIDLLKSPSARGAFGVRYLRDLAGLFLTYRNDWRAATWGDLNNHGPGLLRAAGP
ncbi:MAG: sulfatase-like hydrolase/transferase [Myxococcales bacterium]|nr:sulfatase-like hydrolase/transferase [Myxococcales bacterium]